MNSKNQITPSQAAALDQVGGRSDELDIAAQASPAHQQYRRSLQSRPSVIGWAVQVASSIAGRPLRTLQGQGASAPVRRLRTSALPLVLLRARLRRQDLQLRQQVA